MKYTAAALLLVSCLFMAACLTPKGGPKLAPGDRLLFNGEDLSGWEPIKAGGQGETYVTNGLVILDIGDYLTGLRYTNDVPTINYELELDAMKMTGNDFFLGLTIPVHTNHCTLICGGWGGFVTGISSFDGLDASENDTGDTMDFIDNQWYHVKVRTTAKAIKVWIDDKQIIDKPLEHTKVGMRPGEIEYCAPLGLATFVTRAAYRNFILRTIAPEE